MLIANLMVQGVIVSDNDIPHADIDKEVAKAEKNKFDELNNLMSKYDSAEARVKYMNSPEFAMK